MFQWIKSAAKNWSHYPTPQDFIHPFYNAPSHPTPTQSRFCTQPYKPHTHTDSTDPPPHKVRTKTETRKQPSPEQHETRWSERREEGLGGRGRPLIKYAAPRGLWRHRYRTCHVLCGNGAGADITSTWYAGCRIHGAVAWGRVLNWHVWGKSGAGISVMNEGRRVFFVMIKFLFHFVHMQSNVQIIILLFWGVIFTVFISDF